MLSYEDAEQMAGRWTREQDAGKGHLILDSRFTIHKPYGWVFFYNVREWIEHGDERYIAGGNAPIIINRFDGSLTVTGTAHPLDSYLEKYEASLGISQRSTM